jgi:hypothetical protein
VHSGGTTPGGTYEHPALGPRVDDLPPLPDEVMDSQWEPHVAAVPFGGSQSGLAVPPGYWVDGTLEAVRQLAAATGLAVDLAAASGGAACPIR